MRPLTGDAGDALSWMCLLELKNEQVLETPLCQHNTSWERQSSHPHPVFSPDDQFIYFNADGSGQEIIHRIRLS